MENKHQPYDLAQMQALPLGAKIRMTQARIRAWYEYWDGNVYVSVSGGKDSQVLAHIVKEMYDDVPLVFVDTGLEHDSVRKKGQELADVVLKPAITFSKTIIKCGYPVFGKEIAQAIFEARKKLQRQGVEKNFKKALESTPHEQLTVREQQLLGIFKNAGGDKSAYCKEKYLYAIDAPFLIGNGCCNVMKKNTAHKYVKETKSHPFVATMANESRLRYTTWLKNGCNAFETKHPQSAPLSFWTEQDILQYIKRHELDIAEIYGDIAYTDDDGMYYDNDLFNQDMKLTTTGAKRTGCVFCMFGITQDKDRFLRLKEAEPKKYEYVMRGGKFDENGIWIPYKGLGYKFVIDWLNEHGNLNIKY